MPTRPVTIPSAEIPSTVAGQVALAEELYSLGSITGAEFATLSGVTVGSTAATADIADQTITLNDNSTSGTLTIHSGSFDYDNSYDGSYPSFKSAPKKMKTYEQKLIEDLKADLTKRTDELAALMADHVALRKEYDDIIDSLMDGKISV